MSQAVSTSKAPPALREGDPGAKLPWGLAWSLAVGQLVSWGILYYAFMVVVGPMQAETGWSRSFLNGGLSLGLLVWGLGALPVGVWIQRRGGRGLMAGASLLGGLAFVLMGVCPHPIVYLIAWILLGAAMSGLLYEPAFAVVTRAFGSHYRRGITLITLVGGFASTLFVPLSQVAVERIGWRGALVGLGLIQLAVVVPLHAWKVPREVQRAPISGSARKPSVAPRLREWWQGFRRELADPRFVGLTLWFTAHAAAFTGLIFHLIPVLQALGVPTETIVQSIAVIGPMQVLGRVMLMAGGRQFSTLRVGCWAMAGLMAAMLVLIFLPPTATWLALFAILYGAANGISTILRGTAVAELFGHERYAELAGALAAPAVIAKAAAPLALAQIWLVADDPRVVFVAVLGTVLLGALGLSLAIRSDRRLRPAPDVISRRGVQSDALPTPPPTTPVLQST